MNKRGPIRQAVMKGFPVLDYTFVTESLKDGRPAEESCFKLDTSKIASGFTKNVTPQERHFSKRSSMLYLLKSARKKLVQTVTKKFSEKQPARTGALHYILKHMKEVEKGKQMTFHFGWKCTRYDTLAVIASTVRHS